MVWCALDDYANAKPVKVGGRARQADLATALTVSKSLRQRSKGTSSASLIYTFDKAAL